MRLSQAMGNRVRVLGYELPTVPGKSLALFRKSLTTTMVLLSSGFRFLNAGAL
jgi:hypothetical protein